MRFCRYLVQGKSGWNRDGSSRTECDRPAAAAENCMAGKQDPVATKVKAVLEPVRARKEWQFFAVLPKADRLLAVAWWLILVLRGVLPALFAIAMGVLV